MIARLSICLEAPRGPRSLPLASWAPCPEYSQRASVAREVSSCRSPPEGNEPGMSDSCRYVQVAHERQQRWSAAASAEKSRIALSRAISVALGIAGAILITASTEVQGHSAAIQTALSASSAASIGIAPVLLTAVGGVSALRTWTRLRPASEGQKPEIYTYLAGVAPYAGE